MKPFFLRIVSRLSLGNASLVREGGESGIRRVTSFSTLGESVAEMEGMTETRYQAWVSAEKNRISGGRAKVSV